MLGLDNAGKTTVLNQLTVGEAVETVPTIGFNVETVQHLKLSLTVFDCGGQAKLRELWAHYFINNDGLIFVIDCSDRNRLEEASEELHRVLLSDHMSEVPLLIYANKSDGKEALSADELATALNLVQEVKSRPRQFHIQPSVAKTGAGIADGLSWLCAVLKKTPPKRQAPRKATK